MPSAGFEPAIPASEWTQTHALDRARPLGMAGQSLRFQEFEVPRFQVNRYMEVVMLPAVHTSHLYAPGNNPGTRFC